EARISRPLRAPKRGSFVASHSQQFPTKFVLYAWRVPAYRGESARVHGRLGSPGFRCSPMQSLVSEPLVTSRSRWARPLVALVLGAMTAIRPVYAEAAEVVHVVAKGQTLWHIARRYRTTPEALREVNGLRPGQLL